MLVRSIVSQQISTIAARAIRKRLLELAGPEGLTAANLARFTIEQLRSVGLSQQKASYVADLSCKVNEGTFDLRRLGRLSDERVVAALTQVKGIGLWTAQMFLIFALGRPDVFPHDDLGVRTATDSLVDDFAHGWRDWYLLSADNPHHWEYSTRKLSDPKWQGQMDQRLTLEVQAEQPNELVIVLTENVFRSYRGPQQEYVAVVKLNGGRDSQTIALEPGNFKTSDGEALSSWKNVDMLSLRAYYEKGEKVLGSRAGLVRSLCFGNCGGHPARLTPANKMGVDQHSQGCASPVQVVPCEMVKQVPYGEKAKEPT